VNPLRGVDPLPARMTLGTEFTFIDRVVLRSFHFEHHAVFDVGINSAAAIADRAECLFNLYTGCFARYLGLQKLFSRKNRSTAHKTTILKRVRFHLALINLAQNAGMDRLSAHRKRPGNLRIGSHSLERPDDARVKRQSDRRNSVLYGTPVFWSYYHPIR